MAHTHISFFPAGCSSLKSTKAWSGPCLLLTVLSLLLTTERGQGRSRKFGYRLKGRKWQGERENSREESTERRCLFVVKGLAESQLSEAFKIRHSPGKYGS